MTIQYAYLERLARKCNENAGLDVKACRYEDHCPLGNLCPEHLALHKQRGGSHCASGRCDVCKWNAR